MRRKQGKTRRRTRAKPFYGLGEVKKLVEEEKVWIRENALDAARDAFGWDSADILDALKKLQLKHFYKSEMSRKKLKTVLDYYKAKRLKGENVYTHFYIDDETDTLVINSFKEIQVAP